MVHVSLLYKLELKIPILESSERIIVSFRGLKIYISAGVFETPLYVFWAVYTSA